MLVALLLTAALQAQSTNRPTISYVEITSTWAGLGSSAPFHLTINAKNADPVQKKTIEALAHALQAPAVNAPERRDILDPEQLDNTEEAFRSCLGDALDLPAVQKEVKRLYSDTSNQDAWLNAYYVKRTILHTDDYPHVTVIATLSDGQVVKAESDSQTNLMLPFHVSADGREVTTYNADIPRAAGKMIAGNLNADRLNGFGVYRDFGGFLCSSYEASLGKIAIRSYLPRFYQAVKKGAWVNGAREGLTLSNNLSSVQGEIRQISWPKGVTFAISAKAQPMDARALDSASVEALARVKTATKRITSIPWVRKWLAGPSGPSLMLQWLTSPCYEILSDDLYDNFRRHDPSLYADLRAQQDSTVYGKMWDRAHSSSSGWLFMPDKTLLTEFSDKSTQGPLDGKHLRSWSDFARNENDPTFEFRRAIIILDPQGKIQTALP